jgi:hypothetical protein
MNPLALPMQYYETEGLSTYSIAYTGALAAMVGGVVNIIPSFRDGSMKCVVADVALIGVGMYAATTFLKKAGILEGY